MTDFVICAPAGGPVNVGVAVSGVSSYVNGLCEEDAERSLQLLTSYLAFCARRGIAADTALDILEACRADIALSAAHPCAAFVEAYYKAADLGFEADASPVSSRPGLG